MRQRRLVERGCGSALRDQMDSSAKGEVHVRETYVSADPRQAAWMAATKANGLLRGWPKDVRVNVYGYD